MRIKNRFQERTTDLMRDFILKEKCFSSDYMNLFLFNLNPKQTHIVS